MKYHRKLKRTELIEKYDWKTILRMAASEFSRADRLQLKAGQGANKGKEMTNCLMRAKELVGVIETDRSIPKAAAIKLQVLTQTLGKFSNLNPKNLYQQSMSLAS